MSMDTMPCGCLGHFDYVDMCRFPALETEAVSLREAVRAREAAELAAVAEVTALREKVRALEADNAALLGLVIGMEDGDANEMARAKVVIREPHPGAALLAEMEELRRKVETLTYSLDGYTDFAGPCEHGRDPWDRCDDCGEGNAVQAAARLAMKRERDAESLRARVAELEAQVADYRRECDTLHGDVTRAEAERDAALDRVAELEAKATSLHGQLQKMQTLVSAAVENEQQANRERDAALAKAASAREEALEEAAALGDERAEYMAQCAKVAKDDTSREEYRQRAYEAGGLATAARALKAQPARRMLDAGEVAKVLRASCDTCGGRGDYLPSCPWCHDSTTDHECPGRRKCDHAPLRPLFERLGLSLEHPKP